MKLSKFISKSKRLSLWAKLLIGMSLVYLLVLCIPFWMPFQEGFKKRRGLPQK